MSGIFEFLFKYRLARFQEGEIAFLGPWPAWTALLAATALAAPVLFTYAGARGRSRAAHRVLLGVLRAAALAVIVLAVMQPGLVLTSVVPQRNFVAVLVDDSRSMTIEDRDGSSRADKAGRLLDPEGPLANGLAERFAVRYFRFSTAAERAGDLQTLAFAGSRTRIDAALSYAMEQMQGVPLSGVVLVSDGGDNSDGELGGALLSLRAASVPVFAVGLGDEQVETDVQVDRANAPQRVLAGSSLLVDVQISAHGYEGRTAVVVAEDMGRIVATEEVVLPRDGRPLVVPIAIELEAPGARELSFRVAAAPDERVVENNEVRSMVQVRDRTEKILYFEGEPRHEVAFMLRAVKDDERLQVVLLQRTAENKFFRRNLDDPLELLGGFPSAREELYAYRALVLGSVEAAFFTHDQLDMIADFVSVRGGSLLVLGGRRAFSAGGWDGTPLEDVLPVALDEPDGSSPSDRLVFVKVAPTVAGMRHPATMIEETAEMSAARWDSLPAVSTTHRLSRLKPGATELLKGEVVDGTGDRPKRIVMAFQRYGRGRSAVLGVQDTWLWQMDHTVPLEDQSHETFWTRLLRWLVSETPDQVEASTSREQAEPGEPVTIRAIVADGGYAAVNDAGVVARITAPAGDVRDVPMEWSGDEDGEYVATFAPEAEGIYEVAVEAGRDSTALGLGRTSLRAAPGTEEFRDPHQRRSLLERLAEETGGRYYSMATAGRLPEDVRYAGGGVTVREERDLWDMPALFLLLAGLLTAEWACRRRWALA